MDPTDFGAVERGCPAFPDSAAEEVQLDGFLWILMPDNLKRNRDFDSNVQLLEEFTLKAFLQRFFPLSFTARKFPEAGQVYAHTAFGDQIPAVMTDETSGYLDDFRHVAFLRALNGNVLHIDVIGHSWHAGVLAVQQRAPKSMRAWLKS